MSQAARDENRVPTLIAASSVDGTTPVRIYVNPFTNALEVEANIVPIAQKSVAPRDQNFVPTMLGVSATDGETPVTICADPATHSLFIEHT